MAPDPLPASKVACACAHAVTRRCQLVGSAATLLQRLLTPPGSPTQYFIVAGCTKHIELFTLAALFGRACASSQVWGWGGGQQQGVGLSLGSKHRHRAPPRMRPLGKARAQATATRAVSQQGAAGDGLEHDGAQDADHGGAADPQLRVGVKHRQHLRQAVALQVLAGRRRV